jgi:chaperonin GroES
MRPQLVSAHITVLYSKYAGGEFKGTNGKKYIVLKASVVIAELS